MAVVFNIILAICAVAMIYMVIVFIRIERVHKIRMKAFDTIFEYTKARMFEDFTKYKEYEIEYGYLVKRCELHTYDRMTWDISIPMRDAVDRELLARMGRGEWIDCRRI